MTTFGTMRDRIADELDRADMTTQIEREIKSAIQHYDKQRFWFNEVRNVSFATVDGTEYYGSSADSDIPNLLFIDTLRVAITATDKYDLERVPFQELNSISDSITADEGQPTKYAYYAKQIRLYPIPDASYSIYGAGVMYLGDLSVSADTNAWMTDGEELIRARAKWSILNHVIRDREAAGDMKAIEKEELDALIAATNSRKATGRICPTEF